MINIKEERGRGINEIYNNSRGSMQCLVIIGEVAG